MLRFTTAGESHGKALVVILDGLPAGLKIDPRRIDLQLKRRMSGYGRGGRMKIETDRVEIVAGTKNGVTLASPLAMIIQNRDHKIEELPQVDRPRPGHADLAGIMKYGFDGAREVLERASARETCARVAAGAVAGILLEQFGVTITSHVKALGGVEASVDGLSFSKISEESEASPVRCADAEASKKMIERIDAAKREGDTLGGCFEVLIEGLPPGLGTYVQWDRRLDGLLAQAVMSIPAVKAVSLGDGIRQAALPGRKVHDEIFYDQVAGKFERFTNRAGGVEGGMTNGCQISVSGYMKPIATLATPLRTVRLSDKQESPASTERSDVTAVPACAVIAESVCAITLAGVFLEKFGSDCMSDIRKSYDSYQARLKAI